MVNYCNMLTEAGIEVNRVDFITLSEANQIQVADDVLSNMMKFITDKYNSLDFSEIEKSKGDITKFKYRDMIVENVNVLDSVYTDNEEPGADKYHRVVNSIHIVMTHLHDKRNVYSTLYMQGNGMVQLMYTSLVAACIYATGTLVSNTIRFVTTEKDTPCEVLFEEIPGTIKHVHIKNITAVADDIDKFNRALDAMAAPTNRKAMSESVSLTAATVAIGIGAVIVLLPRIIMLIREIIYSIYYSRVKVADMLGVQADLVRTNIESLEQGRGKKKVIARQKKIAQKLETWKNRIALKMDTTEQLKKTQMRKENASLKVDKDSPYIQNPMDDESSSGLLL